MIDNKTASLLEDYLIINGICASSASLSTVKAGIALTLFELLRTLNDERIGHYAGNILSEALLIKGDNHSMLHGTSGVGYVLLYLIEEGFIEASFDELFADHHQTIISYAKHDLDLNNAINLTPADLFYFARHAAQNDQSREDLSTLHLYCRQLMALLHWVKYAEQMHRIKEKLVSQNLPSTPVRAFLDDLQHELSNNIGFEKAMKKAVLKTFPTHPRRCLCSWSGFRSDRRASNQ